MNKGWRGSLHFILLEIECLTNFYCSGQSFLGFKWEATYSNLKISMIKLTEIFINIAWFQNMLKKLKEAVMIRKLIQTRVILVYKTPMKMSVIWQSQISQYWKHLMKSIKYSKCSVCSSNFVHFQQLAKNIHKLQLLVRVKLELVVRMTATGLEPTTT